MTNFEKLAIASIIEGKLKVTEVSTQDFSGKSSRFLYNLVKKYKDTYGSLPSKEVIEATINNQISEDKAKIYIGYLDGIPENIQDSPEYILEGLRTANNIKLLDSKIESLVELVSERDLDGAREVLKELLETTNDSKSSAIDAKDLEFTTDNIKMLDCYLPGVTNKLQGVTVISAVSAGGKSIFTLNQALHSYKQGKDILYISLELGANESMARFLSHGLQIPFSDIYTDLDESEVAYYNQRKSELFGLPNKFKLIHLGINAQEIINTIRREAETGLDLVCIDYLQIVKNDTRGEKWQFIENFIQDLHRLSLELGIVILSPIQVHTSDISEKNGTITVVPRGSREIEYSSSLFFHIHQNADEQKESLARLITIKARQSKKQMYVLATQFDKMSFVDTGMVL